MGNSSKGFTLIELVTTIVAVSILAISLAPIDAFQQFNLEMAAQRVEQEIRLAKELASTSNVNHGFAFATNAPYTVYRQPGFTVVTNPLTREPLSTDISEQFDNVHILNSGQFEFDSNGIPVIGGDTTVQVGDNQNTVTIQVGSTTGIISRL